MYYGFVSIIKKIRMRNDINGYIDLYSFLINVDVFLLLKVQQIILR